MTMFGHNYKLFYLRESKILISYITSFCLKYMYLICKQPVYCWIHFCFKRRLFHKLQVRNAYLEWFVNCRLQDRMQRDMAMTKFHQQQLQQYHQMDRDRRAQQAHQAHFERDRQIALQHNRERYPASGHVDDDRR